MRDWPAYDRVLAHRGDITVRLSADAVAGWRAPAGRRTFSDAAIAAALTVRTVYRLALRQAEGRRHSLRRGRRFEGSRTRSKVGMKALAMPGTSHSS